jgi:hypothetical protein
VLTPSCAGHHPKPTLRAGNREWSATPNRQARNTTHPRAQLSAGFACQILRRMQPHHASSACIELRRLCPLLDGLCQQPGCPGLAFPTFAWLRLTWTPYAGFEMVPGGGLRPSLTGFRDPSIRAADWYRTWQAGYPGHEGRIC